MKHIKDFSLNEGKNDAKQKLNKETAMVALNSNDNYSFDLVKSLNKAFKKMGTNLIASTNSDQMDADQTIVYIAKRKLSAKELNILDDIE